MENNIPDSWELVKLVEQLNFLPTGVDEFKGTKEYYSTGSIQENEFIPEGEFTFINRPLRANRIVEIGDVLQARMKGTDKGVLVDDKLNGQLFSTGFLQVRPYGETYNNRLLYYLIKSEFFLTQKNELVTGSTQEALTDNGASEIEIPLPPIAEQYRIVFKLDAVMQKIESNKHRLDKISNLLNRFRQSVLSAAVSGKLTEAWREQNSNENANDFLVESYQKRLKIYERELKIAKKNKSRKPARPNELIIFKDVNFDIPNNWVVTNPEFIASPNRYSLAIGPFGSNLKVSDYRDEGVPLIFVRHIKSNDFKGQNPKYVSKDKAIELLPHSVEPLDLLITKMGEPPGDCEIYPNNLPLAIITADCLKFKVWDKYFNRVFYKHLINSSIIKVQLGIITQGVAQQKISLERFKTLHFPVPTIKEQNEIVRRVEHLFAFADKLEARYTRTKTMLDKLSQSFLVKAFRGGLVPQDPNDEPAILLLEKIKAEKEKISEERKVRKVKKNKNTNSKSIKKYKDIISYLKMWNRPVTQSEILENVNIDVPSYLIQLNKMIDKNLIRKEQIKSQIFYELIK